MKCLEFEGARPRSVSPDRRSAWRTGFPAQKLIERLSPRARATRPTFRCARVCLQGSTDLTPALLCLPSKDGLPPLCAESGQAWDTRGVRLSALDGTGTTCCLQEARPPEQALRKRMVLVKEQHHWAVASDLREL